MIVVTMSENWLCSPKISIVTMFCLFPLLLVGFPSSLFRLALDNLILHDSPERSMQFKGSIELEAKGDIVLILLS